MADQFVGEVRIFAGNFPPTGWAYCDGALLPISQNTALFSLLGTNYGGDGKSTFGLPNLQGAFPMHAGSSAGPGLTQRLTGETGGAESVALTKDQIPSHTHAVNAAASASAGTPDGTTSLAPNSAGHAMYHHATPKTHGHMDASTVLAAGGGAPHDNLQPYLALSFIIALQGIFPPRP